MKRELFHAKNGGMTLKSYVKKEDEAQFYYTHIFINLGLVAVTVSMVILRALEGKSFSYFWTGCLVVACVLVVSSIRNYRRTRKREEQD